MLKMREKIGMNMLFLVGLVILVGDTQAAAADEHKSGGGRRRLTASPYVPVPISLLTSAVDKGAGTYIFTYNLTLCYVHIHACPMTCR